MSKPLSSPVGIPSLQPASSQPQSERRALSRFLVLEPRVLLDAAALETADKLLADATPHHDGGDSPATEALADALLKGQAGTAALSAAGGASEVLFVDADVQGYEELIRNLGGNVEVHILTGNDWAGQIQAVLGRRDGDVSAIHLVSHGSAGKLVLGGEAVDAGSLDRYAQAWSAMRQALTAEGDLLLYGCDVAAGDVGRSFIQALTERTGADIAASEDLSGVASLGGNWELEYQAGEIGARSLFADGANGFDGLLADAWVQDTEISAGTSSVAITHTAQGDFKFVGTATGVGPNGHGQVEVYRRNDTTGEWVLFQTLNHNTDGGSNPVGSIKAQFGYSIAAAGNKLVVSAPAFDPSTANASDGRVFVFTWNGTTWAAGVQRIDYIAIQGSGRTGFNGGSSDINDSRGTADQWGYSVDIATDGNGNYRLVIGNPYEDWWEYDNDDNDGDWGGSAVTRNERDDVGAAVVLQASSHGNFGTAYNQITQIYGWTSLTTDNLYFGSTTAVGYDAPDSSGDPGHWWVAVGGSGLDQVRMYLDPAANSTIGGGTYNHQFAYTGSSPNNITMDDDWMVIGNAASLQAYKLTGTTWAAAGSAFGGANAVVFIADRDYSWSSPTNQPPIIVYSGLADGVLYTYTAIWNTSTNQFDPTDLINTGRQEVAVAIDRYRALDILVANASGSQSWHYNWDPVANDDVMTGNEDASFSLNVISNDTDINKDVYGVFGDALVIDGVTTSIFGATITYTGTTVTYNPTTSSYLQTLALGQTAQEKLLVTIRDGQGGFSTSDLIVNIEGRNDAPVVTSIIPLDPFRQQQSNSTVSYDLSVYFNDIDQGENTALVPEVTGLPSGWTWTVDGSYLLLTIPASGATAADGYQGTITVRMKDPHGATSPTRSFKIVVDAVNNAPVVQGAIADQVALAQNAFSFQVPASSFHDPDPAPFDVLTYSATLSGGGPLPSWLVFDPDNRLFVGTPSAADVGTFTVRVAVTDKGGLTTSDDFVISVVDPSLNTVTAFADGDGSNADFGFSTAISQDGNWMVVGSPGWSNSRGEVRYYQWNGTGWTYRGALSGLAGDQGRFGWSVDISDNGGMIVVGARNENGGQGAVYVYNWNGTAFVQKAKYLATGAQQNDYFGTSVAINEAGNHILIGASHYDANGIADSGAAFMRGIASDTGTITFGANILPKDPHAFDRFGTTVAFDQNILVVSAIGVDNASGIVARLQFDESDGIYASASLGGIGGTLEESTGFVNDPERGNVVRLDGANARIILDEPINLGGTNSDLMVAKNLDNSANNTAKAGREQQRLVVTSNTNNFTLTIDGKTTEAIAYNATALSQADLIQAALNTLLGDGSVSVFAEVEGANQNDTFRVLFHDGVSHGLMTSSKAMTITRDVVHEAYDQQLLVVGNILGTAAGNFTLTVDGTTTAPITYSATAATLRTNIENALNALLGAGAAKVEVFGADAASDAFRITFNKSWTISAWYNGVQSNGGYRTLTRGADHDLNGDNVMDVMGSHQIIIDTGTNTLGTWNNSGTGPAGFVSSGYSLTPAQLTGWHNIVAVGEGGVTRFYIDGVLVGTSNWQATDTVSAVGNYLSGGQKFANYLDDFRIYDRALSQSEIRNIHAGVAQADGQYNDMGALYVFSTDVGGQNQVAKLYAPDGHALDMLGWSISVDVYNVGGTRMSGIIAASSIYNDQAATDGGAVYVWRSNDLQSGGDQWNGQAGNGTWDLETKLVSYDVKSGDYFGYAVAVDADETTGNARIVVGTPFESSNGAYAGAVYAYKYEGGVWLPEKFVDANPQGGSQASAAFFGNAVGVAVNSGTSMARAVFTSRWHSTGAETRDGAAYSVNLLTQGNYMTLMAAQVPVFESFSVPAPMAFAVDNSTTQGEVAFNEEGLLVYTPGESFRALAAGETATDSFVYYTQQNGVIYENEVVVTVQGQDHGPEAADDVVYVAANATGVLDVLGNDTDGLTLLSVDAPALVGSLRIDGNRLVYDPQGRFDSLRTGEAAQQSFRYTAVDGQGREVSGTVTLLVTGIDRWPTAMDDTASVSADGMVTVDVVANDLAGSSGSVWLSNLDTSGAIGSFSYDGDGVIRYVPGEAFAALRVGETVTDRVVYTLRDAYGHESSGLLVVTITGTNDGSTPVEPGLPMPHDDVATTQGMTPVRIPVSANDGGGQVVSATEGAHGEVIVQEDGSLLYVPGSTLAMLPAGTVQVDSFSYVVEYEGGRRETATVQVHVNGRYFVPAQEQDEDWRDKLVIVPLSSVSDAYAPPTVADGTAPGALPAPDLRDNVAAMALDGMVEMAAEEGAELDLPYDADTATLPPLADNGGGKPALSALLRREVLARQAGVDALLRHLGERAA